MALGGVGGDPAVPLTPLPLPAGSALPGTVLAMVAMCSVLVAAGAAACYRSVRRQRAGGRGEPRVVAMVPTAGTPPAPVDPAVP